MNTEFCIDMTGMRPNSAGRNEQFVADILVCFALDEHEGNFLLSITEFHDYGTLKEHF